MPTPTQLVFKDEDTALPDDYDVPPSLNFALSSVFARFDGSGAAGTFRCCLDLVSQDGRLMARVPAKEQDLSPGDLARVTWAPFLRASTASTPPPASTSIPTASLLSGNQVISPIGPGDHTVLVDLSAATFRTNTGLLSKALDGAGFWGIQCPGLQLIRATSWLEMRDPAPGNADGQHAVSVVRSVSLQAFGPVPDGITEEAYSLDFTTYVSTIFATAGVQRTEYLQRGSASSFILGVEWDYTAWTVANIDWRFGIIVQIMGDPLA